MIEVTQFREKCKTEFDRIKHAYRDQRDKYGELQYSTISKDIEQRIEQVAAVLKDLKNGADVKTNKEVFASLRDQEERLNRINTEFSSL